MIGPRAWVNVIGLAGALLVVGHATPAVAGWTQISFSAPADRRQMDMAYDAARKRTVLFGGVGYASLLGDTWELDGKLPRWIARKPIGSAPSKRSEHAMVYDPARGRVVLYGGRDNYDSAYTPRGDLWEWDGAASGWEARMPQGASPPPRALHGLAYDHRRRKVITFGGLASVTAANESTHLDDTWEWDGVSGVWTERPSAGAKPQKRQDFAMAGDVNSGKIVLFGGLRAQGGLLDDTWEWDGGTGTWTERPVAGPKPAARRGHRMTYDTVRGKVVLFGGEGAGVPAAVFNDVWEWDSAAGSWTERMVAGSKPMGRGFHAVSYDEDRKKMVVFGGTLAGGRDTWELDSSTGSWAERSPAGALIGPREQHAMTYDSDRGRVILFGGLHATNSADDIWEWDGTTWIDRSPPAPKPRIRALAAIAYDPGRKRVLLFGGQSNDLLRDTWEWNPADGTWRELAPPGALPEARGGHALAYDAGQKKLVLFGGRGEGTKMWNDTWEWDGSAGRWVDRTPIGPSPSARWRHALVYDSTRAKVILFGGGTAGNPTDGSVWEWDGTVAAWTERKAAGAAPSPREGPGLAFDSARNVMVLFGGGKGVDRLQDTWEWQASSGTWTELVFPAASTPSSRALQGMVYDGVRAQVVLYGGSGGGGTDSRLQDTWEYDGSGGTPSTGSPAGDAGAPAGTGSTPGTSVDAALGGGDARGPSPDAGAPGAVTDAGDAGDSVERGPRLYEGLACTYARGTSPGSAVAFLLALTLLRWRRGGR